MLSIISKELGFAVVDKTCGKQRVQLCCCSKLAPNHTPQLSFCFKLARIVKKLKLVPSTLRNCPVAQNWRKIKNVRRTLKCRFRVTVCKIACATVLLLGIDVKTLCPTVVLLEIGAVCKTAENCAKQSAQL